MAEPATDTLPESGAVEPPAETVPPPDTTINNNNNNPTLGNNSDETVPQNLTFELNGEQVSICELSQSDDGQVYLLLQSEKGNQYLIQDPNALDLFEAADGGQLSTLLAQQNIHQLKPNADVTQANLIKDDSAASRGETNQTNSDEIGTKTNNSTTPSNSSPVKKSSIVTEILHSVGNGSHVLKNSGKSSDSQPIATASPTKAVSQPVENGKAIIPATAKRTNSTDSPKVDNKPDTKRTSAQNSPLKSQTKNVAALVENANQSSILGNFTMKSQLANSPKTYSRPRNIQWITPSLKNGVDNSEESTSPRKSVLTTTIEIADDSDEFFSHNNSDEIIGENNGTLTIGVQPILANSNPTENVKVNLNKVEKSVPRVENVVHLSPVKSVAKKTTNNLTNENNLSPKTGQNLRTTTATATKQSPKVELNDAGDDKVESAPKRGRRSSQRNATVEKATKPSASTTPATASKRTRSTESKEAVKETPPALESKSRKRAAPPEPSVSTRPVTPNEQLRSHFMKDSRDAEFFNDIDSKGPKRFCIHIRIQPNERNESKKPRFNCPGCGFDSLSICAWNSHKEDCPLFSRSYSRIENRQATTEYKMEKITFRPFTFKTSAKMAKSPIAASESDDEKIRSDDDDEFSFQGMKKNEVVWAPTGNHGMWPALIVKIFPEQRKISVKFFEYPWKKSSIITDIDSALQFSVGIDKKKWKESNEENLVLKAVSKAEEYNRKRLISTLSGEVMDPDDFFSSQNPKFNIKPHNFQVDSLKVINFIKEGEVDAYLCNIYEKKLTSERHLNFMDKSENKTSGEKNSYGPITDEEHQTDLYSYIINLFKNKYEQTTDLSDPDQFSYCYSVWLPEAIIKAITKLYPSERMDMKMAEEIFNQESVKKALNADEL